MALNRDSTDSDVSPYVCWKYSRPTFVSASVDILTSLIKDGHHQVLWAIPCGVKC